MWKTIFAKIFVHSKFKITFASLFTQKINYMEFGDAFTAIKSATLSKVENINPKGMRLPQLGDDVIVRVQKPDANSKMTAPYLYVESRFGKVPWKETMIELFSDAWLLVP